MCIIVVKINICVYFVSTIVVEICEITISFNHVIKMLDLLEPTISLFHFIAVLIMYYLSSNQYLLHLQCYMDSKM